MNNMTDSSYLGYDMASGDDLQVQTVADANGIIWEQKEVTRDVPMTPKEQYLKHLLDSVTFDDGQDVRPNRETRRRRWAIRRRMMRRS